MYVLTLTPAWSVAARISRWGHSGGKKIGDELENRWGSKPTLLKQRINMAFSRILFLHISFHRLRLSSYVSEFRVRRKGY